MKRPYCDTCKRPCSVCYCHTIKSIDNRVSVAILQHSTEVTHPLGTARIARLSLNDCAFYQGDIAERCEGFIESFSTPPLLVYPGDDAIPLETLAVVQPDGDRVSQSLLFLDGTWRKTRRMLHESPWLASLTRVSFVPRSPSRYILRKRPDAYSYATVEAVAHVLSVIEHNEGKYQPLLATLDWILAQNIHAMGAEVFNNNYS